MTTMTTITTTTTREQKLTPPSPNLDPSFDPKHRSPFLPSEVINLIISHYIGSYTLHLSHAWWDFESPLRIHNIPHVLSLALVSRTFSTIVKHHLRKSFTGILSVEHDAAENMRYYCRDGHTEHIDWLFENAYTLQIVGLGLGLSRSQPLNRAYVADLRHWPNLHCLEVEIRVSLLAHIRTITKAEHDAEVIRIASSIYAFLQTRNAPKGLMVCFVFRSCRCGEDVCLAKPVEGGGDAAGWEVLHRRPDV